MISTMRRLALLAVAIFVLSGMAWTASEWTKRGDRERLDAHVHEIIAVLPLATDAGFHERVDAVRTFINDHSIHKIDEEFWDHRKKPSRFAANLIARAKDPSLTPVHMECSTRSNLMARILSAMGYQTRIIAIYDSRANLSSHTFLEVLDPQNGIWQTQDPDLDVYWRNVATKERTSLVDAAEDLDSVEPCGRAQCGWDRVNIKEAKLNKLKSKLDIISITEQQKTVRFAVYTSRADLDRVFTKGKRQGSFCDVEAKRCDQGFYDIRRFSTYAPGRLR